MMSGMFQGLMPAIFGCSRKPLPPPDGPEPPMTDYELAHWQKLARENPDLLYNFETMTAQEREFILLTEGGWIFEDSVCFRSELHLKAFHKFQDENDYALSHVGIEEWHPSDIEFATRHARGLLVVRPLLLQFCWRQDRYLFQAYLISNQRKEALAREKLIPDEAPQGMPIPRGLWRFNFQQSPPVDVQVHGAHIDAMQGPMVIYRARGAKMLSSMRLADWRLVAQPFAPFGCDTIHCSE